MSENKPMSDERLKEIMRQGNNAAVQPMAVGRLLWECITEIRRLRDELAITEIRRLRDELAEERRFCICGCPMDDHENCGEDGFACGDQYHECVLVCAAAATIAKDLRAEVERLKEERSGLCECVEMQTKCEALEDQVNRLEQHLDYEKARYQESEKEVERLKNKIEDVKAHEAEVVKQTGAVVRDRDEWQRKANDQVLASNRILELEKKLAAHEEAMRAVRGHIAKPVRLHQKYKRCLCRICQMDDILRARLEEK